MSNKINSSTIGAGGLISTADGDDGILLIQSNGSTVATFNGTGILGDGSQLTNLPAADLSALNATNLTSGTVPDARFPATLPAANGSALTNLTAGNITGGVGKVLQVKQVVKLDTATAATAYGSWADISGMSLAITPSASSSKILVMVNGSTSPSSNNYSIGINLVRGSTSIFIANSRSSATRTSDWGLCQSNQNNSVNIVYLDSPSTTGATTYKIQMASEQGNTALFGGSYSSGSASNGSVPGSIILMEIGA